VLCSLVHSLAPFTGSMPLFTAASVNAVMTETGERARPATTTGSRGQASAFRGGKAHLNFGPRFHHPTAVVRGYQKRPVCPPWWASSRMDACTSSSRRIALAGR